jgi:YidC/Oxa1 family membrane protein insertase
MEIDSTQEFTEESPSPFKPDDWQVVLDKGAVGPGEVRTFRFEITALPTMTKTMAQAGHNNLIYADLWAPLGALCRWVEALLSWLSSLVGNLGLAMLLFAIATRFVTLPASIWASRRQQEYKMRFERAKPQMDKARRDFKGAERSERILAIYKDNRITPFSGLKGSVGLLVQIPFLLAIFNVTTRSSIFAHEEFLWISDLALPDAAMALPFVIPILGGHVNVLPLALGVFNILSSVRDQDTSHTSKVIPIIISLLIVTVFYSFSAALVLYWLTVNLLQAGERITLQRSKTST